MSVTWHDNGRGVRVVVQLGGEDHVIDAAKARKLRDELTDALQAAAARVLRIEVLRRHLTALGAVALDMYLTSLNPDVTSVDAGAITEWCVVMARDAMTRGGRPAPSQFMELSDAVYSIAVGLLRVEIKGG